MYVLYALLFCLIYIYLFIAFEVFSQNIKIGKDFFFFCTFYAFFCFLALISYMGYDKYKELYYIYESLFPLCILSLLSFCLNIQIDKKKEYLFLKNFFSIMSIIIFITNLTFYIQTTKNMNISEAFIINGLTFEDFRYYISSLYYFCIFSIIIVLLFSLNAKVDLERDKKSTNILIATISVYCVYVFFINIIFPRLYDMKILHSNTFISILPIFGIYIAVKLYDLSGANISKLLAKTLENSPEGICLLYDEKIKYVNSKFQEMFFGEENVDLISKNIFDFFPKEICKFESVDSRIFTMKRPFSDEYINILCHKVQMPQILNYSSINIMSILDVSFIKEAQEKIEHINKNLENIIKESTQKLEDVSKELSVEVQKRIDSENKMILVSSTDALTGLYNRRYFSQIAHNIILNANPHINKHLIIYLDLDNFKNINDTLGHSVGDIVLKEIANRLRESVPDTSIISRIGGDEFLIFVKNERSTPEYLIPRIGNKILKNLREPIRIEDNIINTSISVGISVYPDCGKDVETLIKNADIAMYNAKENGKNSYSVFEAKYHHIVKTEFDLTNDMIMAITKNEFKIFYQPKIAIIDNIATITGFEALIRWFHPTKGLIPPSVFIPIAERSGYISTIFKWVLDEVCKQTKIWSKTHENFNISINFSSPKFEETHVYEYIGNTLKERDVDPKYIHIEISEKYLGKNITNAISTLNYIKSLGIKIIIDDFGTEYSSLNYLKSLPVDCIKIDMNFTKGIGYNKKDEAIIIALIKLCENTDIDIIAEGIETKEQYDFLISHGLKKMQGFYFYKPMPVEDIEKLEIFR